MLLHLLPPSWVGILWAVSTNMGEVGWKMAQAKVSQRQEQRQVSKLELWSCQHCSQQAKSGWSQQLQSARSEQGTHGQSKSRAGRAREEANKETLPSLLGSPLLLLWALTSFCQGSHCYRLAYHPALLLHRLATEGTQLQSCLLEHKLLSWALCLTSRVILRVLSLGLYPLDPSLCVVQCQHLMCPSWRKKS